MLYDSATNQNLCMSSEIKRPALLSTYWPIKISGHQDHVKMIKLISFCREKNATKAQQDLELCCPSAPFVVLHGTLQMHDGTDGTDGVGLGYGRNQKPATYRKWVCEMRYTQKNGVASLPRQDCQFMQFWDKRSNSDPHRKDDEFRGLNSWVLYPAALRPAFLAPEVLWEWRHSNVDHTWESTAKALQTCDLTNFGPSQQ